MSDGSQHTIRAILLATIMVCSVVAGGVGFAGSAGASQSGSTTEDLTAAEDVAAQVDVSPGDLSGDGTQGAPYIITNASELQAMEDDLDAHYRLGSDINASNTSSWNGGKGFDPVGGVEEKINTPGSSFNGSFDGDGHTITGLTINRSTEDFVGLFGNTSSESAITSVTMTGIDVTGNENVGGLAGDHNGGTIHNVSIDGTVTGELDTNTNARAEFIGGIAGASTGEAMISNVSASVTVTGTVFVGGAVGSNGGTIRDVSASEETQGYEVGLTNAEYIGGLVGSNSGSIRTASAGGAVNGTERVGGLVGTNFGTGSIRNASATGSVEGFLAIGGLAGTNVGTTEKVSASGDVLATSSGGGLVGINGGNITNVWASGAVTIEEDGQNRNTDFAGGLVAESDGTIQDAFAVGSVSSQEPASNVTTGGLLARNFLTTYPPNGTVRDAYWDRQTTNQPTSAGNATSLNTSQMIDEAARSNMSGLTYGEVWTIRTNDYPTLIDDPKGPTAFDDAYSTPEDSTLTVPAPGVLGNDTDPDSDPLTATVATPPTNGSLTFNANGSFEYTPNADFAGTDSFTYNVSDGTLSDTGMVTITVSQVNDPPTATDDSYSTSENSTLSVSEPGVLGNDSDPENDALSVTRVSGPTNGTLSLATNGSFTYTPDPGFVDTDSFTYNASDGEFNSTATVTIAVNEANDPPIASDDNYSTSENGTLIVSQPGVLGNDSDPNGDSLNATRVSGPANGSLTLSADGSFSYTPNPGFVGTDSFTYNATDGQVNDTATVTIDVVAVDDNAPIVKNATAKEYQENSYTVRDGDTVVVTANVTDPDGSAITSVTVDATGLGAGSSVSLSETTVEGVYKTTFTANSSKPNAGDGSYILQVTATDSAGNTNSNTTGFPITLDNVPPTANATANETEISPGDTVRFNASNSTDDVTFGLFEHRWDFDSDGVIDTTRFFSITETVTHTFRSTGTYTVNLTVTDQAGNADNTSLTINVTEANLAPVADDDTYSTSENSTLSVTRAQGVLANDQDSNGDTLNATRVSGPSNGTLSLAANGSFSYTPTPGFTGTDSFTYNASDGELNDTATATITVTAVNDAPIARNDSYTVAESTDASISQLDVSEPGVLENDSDPNGDSLNATRVSGPTNGTLSLAANRSFTYEPTQTFVGTDSFTYSSSDGSLTDTATVTITVTGENRAPTANDDSYSTTENETLTVPDPGVLDDDSDPDDGDQLEALIVTSPANGTLTLNRSGGFSYTPDPGFTGTDSFTYTASDGQLNDTATVTITVEPKDQPAGPSEPAVRAPDDGIYLPSEDGTPEITFNATGVIDPADVGIVIRNATAGNGTVIANVTPGRAEGTEEVLIPGGTLSGNATLNVTLVNATTDRVYASDRVNLTAVSAPAIFAPANDTYDPTAETTIGTFHVADGVIAPGDVAVRLRNVTGMNDTVVATNTSVPLVGDANTTVSAGALSGNVTLQAELYNSSTGVSEADARLKLTAIADRDDETDTRVGESAPAVLVPTDGSYNPDTEFNLSVDYNATDVVDAADVEVRFRNATAGNGTLVATATPGAASGDARVTIPAGTLSGDVTINVTLANGSTGDVYASDLVNYTAEPTDGGDAEPAPGAPAAPAIVAPADATYQPDTAFNFTTLHNASGVIAPADVGVRLRNVTGGNSTVVASNGSVPVEGESVLTIPAGALDGDVRVRAELYNSSNDTTEASTIVNLTTGLGDEIDAEPVASALVPSTASVDQSVELDARGSVDDGAIVEYNWTITAPDGTTSNHTGSVVTFTPAQTGTYEVELTVTDDAGQTDTVSETMNVSEGPAVVASSVTHVAGTQPDMTNVSLRAEFSSGLLQLQIQNASNDQAAGDAPSDDYELEGLGADDTTRLRVNVTVTNFTPRVLIGSANDVNWTRTRTADGNWTISITGSPAEVHSYFDQSSDETDWNGSLVATQSQNQTITYAVDGLSTTSAEYRERLNGSVFITDAQEFGVPRYNDTATPDRVELTVAAPHFETDGQTVNEGFFEAYLPSSLLDEWNVTAADLVGRFNGTRKATTVAAMSDGGARVSFNVTYSEGTAAVTYNDSEPTEPSIVAPSDRTYDPINPQTISTDHDAAGAIDSDDVAVRLVNVTDGNNTVVALNDSVPVAGEVDTTIPAAELSGNVTIETQLYNNSSASKQVVATDTVTLTVEAPTDDDDSDNIGGGGDGGPPGDGGSDGGATFGETQQVTDSDLPPGVIRAESTVADNLSVGLLRSSAFNYSLAITGPENATNVTFYLQTKAISNSQDIENLTMYLNDQPRNFTVNESAGPGNSPWVRFTIPHFSTQVISFTSGTELSNASVAPTTIQAGEIVTVEATLENTGGQTTTVTLNLTDNGTRVDSKDVTVAPGENTTVNFTRTLDTTGEHELGISGLSAGTVNVTDSDSMTTEEEETSSQAPGFGPVVTLAALLSAALLALRRRTA